MNRFTSPANFWIVCASITSLFAFGGESWPNTRQFQYNWNEWLAKKRVKERATKEQEITDKAEIERVARLLAYSGVTVKSANAPTTGESTTSDASNPNMRLILMKDQSLFCSVAYDNEQVIVRASPSLLPNVATMADLGASVKDVSLFGSLPASANVEQSTNNEPPLKERLLRDVDAHVRAQVRTTSGINIMTADEANVLIAESARRCASHQTTTLQAQMFACLVFPTVTGIVVSRRHPIALHAGMTISIVCVSLLR
jgi:hypothetical protein